MNAAVSPASSKAGSNVAFCSVQSWELRSPAATRRATGPRATPRAPWTSICNSKRCAAESTINVSTRFTSDIRDILFAHLNKLSVD